MKLKLMDIRMLVEQTVLAGTPLVEGQWIFITDGRWYQATLDQTGIPYNLESDELVEVDANRLGIFRPI